jgi:tetratricopeptide (TPR) repeat protein
MNRSTFSFKNFLALFVLMLFSVEGIAAQSLEDALKLYNYGKRDEGIAMMQQLNQSNPSDAFTAFELARILSLRDMKTEVAAIFQKLASGDPKAPATMIGQVANLMNTGNVVDAKKIADKVARSVRRDGNMLRLVGEALLLGPTPDFASATTQFEAAITIAKNVQNYMAAGRAKVLEAQAKSTGNVGDAITKFEYAVDLFPTDPSPPMQVANLFYRVKNYDEAEKWYLKALQRDPKFGPALRELAEMAYEAPGQNQWTKAKTYYKQLLDVLPEREADWLSYVNAMYFARPRDCDGILQSAPKITQLFPSSGQTNYLMRLQSECTYTQSNNGTDLQKVNEALDLMNNFMQKSGADKILPSDFESLGTYYEKLKADSLAILNYNKTLELDTTKTYLYGSLAALHYNTAVTKANQVPPPANMADYWLTAAKYFGLKISTSEKPRDSDFIPYSYCLYYAKKYAQADSVAAVLVGMRPDLPIAYYQRGISSENLERDQNIAATLNAGDEGYKKDAAKPYFEKFIELALATPDPTRYKSSQLPRAYTYLVDSYMNQKDWANAKIYVDKFFELKPDDQGMKDKLAVINNGGKPVEPPKPPKPTRGGTRPTGGTASAPASGTTTAPAATTRPASTTTAPATSTKPKGN